MQTHHFLKQEQVSNMTSPSIRLPNMPQANAMTGRITLGMDNVNSTGIDVPESNKMTDILHCPFLASLVGFLDIQTIESLKSSSAIYRFISKKGVLDT